MGRWRSAALARPPPECGLALFRFGLASPSLACPYLSVLFFVVQAGPAQGPGCSSQRGLGLLVLPSMRPENPVRSPSFFLRLWGGGKFQKKKQPKSSWEVVGKVKSLGDGVMWGPRFLERQNPPASSQLH